MTFSKPLHLSSSSSSRRCVKPEPYALTSDEHDNQCIALTAESERCSRIIGKQNLKLIIDLQAGLIAATDAEDIHDKAQALVLARCCGRSHREPLRSDPDKLYKAARHYIKGLRGERTLGPTIQEGKTQNGVSARGIVIPYSTKAVESIRWAMRKDAGKLKGTGVVYAFTSSMYPGIIKIGYSGNSTRRPAQWSQCMPDLTVLIEKEFPFPRRMERLIHLELHDRRRKVGCASCSATHRELFEVSVEDALRVIEDWHKLVDKHRLYSEDGLLEPVWVLRMTGLKGNVTARKLLDVLEAEEQEKEKLKKTIPCTIAMSLRASRSSVTNDTERIEALNQRMPTLEKSRSMAAAQRWKMALQSLSGTVSKFGDTRTLARCATVNTAAISRSAPILVA